MRSNPKPLRCWTVLLLAACAWLSACAGGTVPVSSTPFFHCDRNGTQEERVACQ